MVHRRLLLALLAPASLALLMSSGCGGGALQSNELKFTLYEAPVLVKETGAIILDKRQVGRVLEDGKIIDSRKRPLAFLSQDSIRLRGGVVVPIRKDQDGTLFLSKKALEKANLKPVRYRIRKNGTMASTKNAAGLPVRGAHLERNRRVVLVLLLLSANDMWQ